MILLARFPFLERLVGFDRLTVWHRWNGHATIDLVVAHVFFSVWGYAEMDKFSIGKEISTMLGGGIYPGMITATVGTGLLVAVVGTSYVIVRRRLRYEWWYAVHFLAYAGIALGVVPPDPDRQRARARHGRRRLLARRSTPRRSRSSSSSASSFPLVNVFRYRLRVAAVVDEGPDVVSVWITGRRLERLRARAGQFFVWRFLTPGRWWSAHPFSLSAAPDGQSLRITVKELGDHSGALASLPVGTRVLAEGPFGVFTDASRRGDKIALVAGGIGITPVRALMQEAGGDVVVLYRALTDDDLVLRDEIEKLAAERGIAVHFLVGDHATPEGARLLAPESLRELVPDLAERDVFVCGPPGMADAAVRNVRAAGVSRRHIHVERFAL